ncbi:sulfite exporter TauE/SafE family protein [Arenibaculum pallidiluteum]|uniref:sulfite exporter TauE/SafE family protein n=1 Tax=Arenibaculum pallidiluteum TaxID=2812559 RepID=UPI002E28FAD1|nr:sulfite exporter TauE/SafE family protein [Arenibaculum pallidiluteum]
MLSILLLAVAAFMAGALNALAGGGTFLTFPALVFLGVPPIAANATSTVSVLPGYVSSAYAFRRDVGPVQGVGLPGLMAASLAGGVAGALLLLVTPAAVFSGIVPWLLLVATVLFAFGPRMTRWLRSRGGRPAGKVAVLATVTAVSVYGGYFNGGLGILLLAAFSLLGLTDLNRMNGLKVVLSAVLAVISAATFAVAGIVAWQEAAIMAIAATLGGYWGARAARRIPPDALRMGIVAVGLAMSVLFFAK